MSEGKFFVTAYYYFKRLTNLSEIKEKLVDEAVKLSLRGLVIIGPDGINSTVAAPSIETRTTWQNFIRDLMESQEIEFKDSIGFTAPFKRFSVKIREEICTVGHPEQFPGNGYDNHLSPSEWNAVMEKEDVVLIDTRNWYEFDIGTFEGAVNPETDKFTEFFDSVDSLDLPKDKKILVFCTGGIRCHKGVPEMKARGYNNVWQLKGGILKYLEEFPEGKFKGECFVFDKRVALDKNLEPSKQYTLCPHCGQPAPIKINCKACGTEALICADCQTKAGYGDTCSKNCHNHFLARPGKKVKKQLYVLPNYVVPNYERKAK